MEPHSLVAVPRVLRWCLHLLVLALLALPATRALATAAPQAGAVVGIAAVLAACYALGAALPAVRRSRSAAASWIVAVSLLWLALLTQTPDGVWLAFPLFFLQLHLLPLRPGLAAVAATTAAAIGGFAWHQPPLTAATVLGPSLGAGVAVATVLGYQALYRESERRRRLLEELTAARAELAAAEHARGVAAERERLAREIHDTLAQGLSSIQLLLRAAERALPDRPEVAAGHVEHARRTAVDNLAEARRFVRALAPPDLEHGSLPSALERLCTTTATTTGRAVRFQVAGEPVELPTAHEVALLRIAQSALANTVRHAAATRAEVTLSYMPGEIALDVVDDGVGFDADALPPAGSTGGFGLPAMRARAAALGGRLSVESASGQGTAVAVTLPVATPVPA